MNFNHIQSDGVGPVPLPSLMYVEAPRQQEMHQPQTKKRPNKVHVSAACINCKKAHLACDVSRPCNRCVSTDKADTCRDIQHKKRGRPKMMRDANNNKIRPIPNTPSAAVSQSLDTDRIMSGPNVDCIATSTSSATSSNEIMIILLSMDLCCARVSDKSLEYLQLYPQEFSHRSLYDLLSGENQQNLSKLHRCLLDNAVQHQTTRLPNDLIRSSSERFFTLSFDSLLNIANGSLTLKQKLKFRKGRDASDSEEMNCRFYLGGGFGADLFDASTFDQLYIVCIASPAVNTINFSDVIHLPPLVLNNNNESCSTVSSPMSPTATHAHMSPPDQTKPENESEPDNDDNSGINTPATATGTSDSSNTIQLPLISSQHSSLESDISNSTKSALDRFRYNTKPASQQFIHPNELYYLQTTSSRLSSEAIAHTALPYLSKSPGSVAALGSGPLANYNSHFQK
ncbi:hypothetical protein [Parasitella parasitica]|uniref:Zn(2)-C6 fungal-type domain-containing protein n=1 Tax=Parasitella parasitica TaxID=35722 RepID=A0A0B7NQS4_9FUNG|nr:hypothetical protein [Parasitella parasitica]